MKISKETGLLLVLVAIQSVYILHLKSQSNDVADEISAFNDINDTEQFSPQNHANVLPPQQVLTENDLSQELIRQLIKEELHNYFAENPVQQNVVQQQEKTFPPNPEKFAQYSEKVDVMISQGAVSQESLEFFYSDLSGLNPDEINSIVRRIAVATNSGQLNITSN
ncbi:MAG: hypothetical protein OEY19_11985 [Gammaproteobacteria bacterium]|nr:hypothetical protein [Gammaproteobacteria bacterium]